MNTKKKFLIFIPAYNVEDKIYSVVNRIPKKIFKSRITILIINDCSKDNTQNEIIKIKKKFNYNFFIINNKKQLGYGGSQKIAFNYAIKNKFDILIMVHGDGQYAPEEIPRFINQYKNKNTMAVFGSRMLNYKSAIRGGMPIYKFIGNICLTFIQNLILGTNISEFHSGYRSFRVGALKNINFKSKANYYHFDTEIIIELIKKNLELKEIPIPTHYGDEISHLKSIPYGLNVLLSTIKYRFKIK